MGSRTAQRRAPPRPPSSPATAAPTPSTRRPRIRSSSASNMYIADTSNNRVREVDTSGIITTIVGNGTASSTGDGGPAASATINSPRNLAFDSAGNLYIAEYSGQRIRKVDTGGTITTF